VRRRAEETGRQRDRESEKRKGEIERGARGLGTSGPILATEKKINSLKGVII
jgi:hypothetical protein